MVSKDVRPARPVRGRRVPVLLGLALLTQACMMSTQMDIDIRRDGSGSADLLLQYDENIARLVGPAAQFERDVLEAQADGADVEVIPSEELDSPYAHGLRYQASFDDPDGLRDVLLDGPFDTATVRLEDGVLDIDAVIDTDDIGEPDEFGFDGMVSVDAVVTMDVDGTVTSSNAMSSSGSVHTWQFNLAQDGGRLQLTAEMAGGPPLAAIASAVVLLVLVGLAILFVRGRSSGSSSQPQPTDEESGIQPPAQGPAGPFAPPSDHTDQHSESQSPPQTTQPHAGPP